MTFRVVHQPTANHARSAFRVVEQTTGREVEWVNRYLDFECLRRVADLTLRSYAQHLLHFIRWWESVHHTDAIAEDALTESTLLDYVRFQASQQPEFSGSTINQRVAVADRALRAVFPGAPRQIAPGLQVSYWRRAPMGLGRPLPAVSRLRVRESQRTIVPLSVDEVARFWSSFRTARDLAIVGLMLLQGLRSQEVRDLNRDDLLLPEAQIRVRGKGDKTRYLPLAPETIQLLDHYLRLERPNPSTAALFVSLKGRARGARMTAAGLRSLFRYHRQTTGVKLANPHRFRHYAEFRTMPSKLSAPLRFRLFPNTRLGIVCAAPASNAGRMETPFDYFFDDRTNPRTIEAVRSGPLALPLEAYARRLREDGYAVHSGFVQLRLLGCFNRWLDRKGLTSEDVDAAIIEQYLRGRAQSRKLRRGDSAALFRLLTMLRPEGSGMTAPLPTPVEVALGHFQQYLRQERSLSEATVINYTPVARSFLSERFPKGALHFQQITAADITAFVQRQAALVTSKRAPLVVTALRSFLRYLFHRGIVAIDLATCVPTIATWSLSNVPRFLAGEQIQKILGSCDKETAIGKRDYAMLLLLARLGLRAGEVVALTLDDFDWDAGLVTVRGKGKRVAQMPLPSEVGTAIADYLSTGRPTCSSRRVFIRAKAPLIGFANSIAICSLVDRALERAGVESEYRGSHVFRHSLATGMLSHGASLDEIGDVLRHRRPDTTRIYAKVDLVSLRSIALPWPGGSR